MYKFFLSILFFGSSLFADSYFTCCKSSSVIYESNKTKPNDGGIKHFLFLNGSMLPVLDTKPTDFVGSFCYYSTSKTGC